MIKEAIKFWGPYVVGVVVVVALMGVLQDGKADWESLVRVSIAGLIGTIIGTGLKKLLSAKE